eukprot:scaffold204227_cov30-Tisochrysis_lutea.AAC.2
MEALSALGRRQRACRRTRRRAGVPLPSRKRAGYRGSREPTQERDGERGRERERALRAPSPSADGRHRFREHTP